MRALNVILVLTLLGLPACGTDSGVEVGQEIDRLEAIEHLRIGSIDDPEYQFTWFSTLVVDDEGQIFTLHPMESEIRVHDGSGHFIGTIGGPGEGPGEFKSARIAGLVGDTLWVLDSGTYRFNYFSTDGTFLRSVSVPIDLGASPEERPPRPIGMLTDGTLLASPPAWSRLIASGDLTEGVVLAMTPGGGLGDTLYTTDLTNTTLEVYVEGDSNDLRLYMNQPYADAALTIVVPGEPAYIRVDRRVTSEATTGNATITKLLFEGAKVFETELPMEKQPVPGAAVDSFLSVQRENLSQVFSEQPSGKLDAAVRRGLYIPEFLPPVQSLVVGRDASIWLRLFNAEPSEAVQWIVMASDGAIEGMAQLPRAFRMLEAEQGQVWGMELDELDVPYIVSYLVADSAVY